MHHERPSAATAKPGGAPAIEMRGIHKAFGPVEALSDVHVSVRAGTVHALVGENGAGKSTLMKILAGVHLPDRGTISMGGEPAHLATPRHALEAGIAMIYQELSLAQDLTVAENIFLGMEPRGRLPWSIDHRAMASRAQDLARKHDLDLDPEAPVDKLSAGDCQQVEILKSLARRASIIVMDEPTSSLGRTEALSLLEVARSLRAHGVTIIYISHRLEEVMAIADDITVLRDGQVAHSGPLADTDPVQIVRHMVGRQLDEYYPPRAAQPGKARLEVSGLSTATGVAKASFAIRAGEIVGLAGLLGAGRTALGRALFGLDRLTAGTICLDGVRLEAASPAQAIEAGVAYLPEDRKRSGLCLDLPACWNATLSCLKQIGTGRFIWPKREAQMVAPAAEKMTIKWESPLAPTTSLSGGNQQKLLLLRGLLADSHLLILDEPTRGVDVAAKADIYRLFGELAASGKAVLLISSELPELLGVTDRILVMRRGRIVADLETVGTDQQTIMEHAALDRSP